jgi:hypothetical protein
MFIQKDIYPEILKNNTKFSKQATKVDYSDIGIVKPMKGTTNLILNQRTASLHRVPIQNSDKKQPDVIKPYSKFKGSEVLPTFKKDLKAWKIC